MAISKKQFEALQPGDALVDHRGKQLPVEKVAMLANGARCVTARDNDRLVDLRWMKFAGVECIVNDSWNPVMSLNDNQASIERASV